MKDLVEPISKNKKEQMEIKNPAGYCKLLNFYSYFNYDNSNVYLKNVNSILDLNQIMIKKRYIDPNKEKIEVHHKNENIKHETGIVSAEFTSNMKENIFGSAFNYDLNRISTGIIKE